MRNPNLLPYETIVRATSGEPKAVEEVLRHYSKHREEAERLNRKGFTDPAMREWTFENDNGKCPQMHNAYSYVERREQIGTRNYGLILWGKVGTGKSYFAGCIANALMEKEVSVA